MQFSTIVRNLRLTGLIIGFTIFALTTIRLIQYNANPSVVQNGLTLAKLTSE